MKIRGNNLNEGKQLEYLVCTLITILQINKDVDSMYKKARNKLGILYKIRRFISNKTALLIIK